ncbi:MAG TPA: iron-sulfur cluster assembly accessory protein [Cytophagaceae bacterium]|nr:iron-sulfur cluster assembly accessory protein [Cytophagaceae bacterium]
MTSSKKIPFRLTEAALAEVKNIFQTKNIPEGYGLRVGIRGGGCSGISYLFGFDKKQETDEEFEVEEVPVYVEKKHFMYVMGLNIDFEDGTHARGFIFENPDTKF